MIESITAITIIMLLLAYFRPGKTPPLEKPLHIVRTGKYQMILAAKLNLAQPFLEDVAQRIRPQIVGIDGFEVQYFVVRDKQVKAHGSNEYLLAIGCRNQMLSFYAANPKSSKPNEYLELIEGYSNDFSIDFPSEDMNRQMLGAIVVNAIMAVAEDKNIDVIRLTQ